MASGVALSPSPSLDSTGSNSSLTTTDLSNREEGVEEGRRRKCPRTDNEEEEEEEEEEVAVSMQAKRHCFYTKRKRYLNVTPKNK